MSNKMIIAIGAAVQVILFFTPLAEMKWGAFSGWEIANSGIFDNAGMMWFFLIIPIALLVSALMKATSMVLGMISLSGLIAVLIWVVGFGDGWEFLAPTYIKLLLYIGLTIYAFVKKDMASNDCTGNSITIPSNVITSEGKQDDTNSLKKSPTEILNIESLKANDELIITSEITLKDKASYGGNDIIQLKKGDVVRYIDNIDDKVSSLPWLFVETENGQKGYHVSFGFSKK